MPHLDFRQAFASPDDRAPVVSAAPAIALDEIKPSQNEKALATRLPRLHRSDRTTILFAVFVFVGGLFCASYFFNGGEILRAAAAWAREYLYPRPAAQVAASSAGNPTEATSNTTAIPSDKRERSKHSPASDTKPFGPRVGSLNPPAIDNSPGAGGFAGNGSPAGPAGPLNQLGGSVPGGDALLQSLNQGADNIARAAAMFANSTTTVVRTVVKAPASKTSQIKSAAQNAANVGNQAAQAGQVAGAASNAAQKARSTVRNVQDDMMRDLGRQGLGLQGLGGIGGLGDGVSGFGGAAAGLGGGSGGALGGAMGAAGGAVGGLGLGGGH